MALVACTLSVFLGWRYPANWNRPGVLHKTEFKYSKEDTYIVIFNFNQQKEYELLFSDDTLKIVFQSQPAVNTIHPSKPRNFVVVFELNDKDTAVPQV
jgi:hypothetical protein